MDELPQTERAFGTPQVDGIEGLESEPEEWFEYQSAEELMPLRSDQNLVPQLCKTCRSLKLSVDRFIVQVPGPSTRDSSAFTSVNSLVSSPHAANLGTLQDLQSRGTNGCPLCDLIAKSIDFVPGPTNAAGSQLDHLGPAVCHGNWEIDGRRALTSPSKSRSGEDTARGLTRRFHLTWNHPHLSDAYLVFVTQAREYFKTGSDAYRTWGRESLFLGRRIQSSGTTHVRLKSWFDLCQDGHSGPCGSLSPSTQTRFRDVMSHSYFGVIDVVNMHLTELPLAGPGPHAPRLKYAALSYVWGTRPSFTATLENINSLRLHGGLGQYWPELPPVIRDTILLVRSLGLRFLWVDALCITQDSKNSWKLNAFNMDSIYGGAHLTICAADGEDGFTGLCAMKREENATNQMIADCGDGVHLMVSRPPETYVRASKWNTRAWTFQERLLSRRCLIFVAGRVYFQCRSTGMSEDLYADREGAGWSLDLVDAPMQMFRQLPQRSFWVYSKVVSLYSSRALTKPKDILAAFSGITNVMEERMCAPFVFGLPTSHFDLALLWQHTDLVDRRKPKTEEELTDYEGLEFPSWSWMGWLGTPTNYRHDALGDTLENPSEWLERHTWIRWYIRDGKGDLRPLWDPKAWTLDGSEDARWRGYSGIRTSAGAIFQHFSDRGKPAPYPPRIVQTLPPPPPPPPPPPTTRPRGVSDTDSDFSSTGWNSSNEWDSTSGASSISYRHRRARSSKFWVKRRDTSGSAVRDNKRARSESVHKPVEHMQIAQPTIDALWGDIGAVIRLLVYPMIVFFKMIGCREFANMILQWTQTMDLRSCFKTWMLKTLGLERLSESLSNHQSRDRRSTSGTKSRYRGGTKPSIFLSDRKRDYLKYPFEIHAPLPPAPMPIDPRSLDHTKHRSKRQLSAPQNYARPGASPHLRSPLDGPFAQHAAPSDPTQGMPSQPPPSYGAKPYSHQVQVQPGGPPIQRPPPPYGMPNAPHPPQGQPQSQRYDGSRPGVPLSGQPQYTTSTQRSIHTRPLPPVAEPEPDELDGGAAAYDNLFRPHTDLYPQQTESTPQFHICPKECPYKPKIAGYSRQPNSSEFPLMPILQFYTYYTWLYIEPASEQCNTTSSAMTGLNKFHVADRSGDWCGSIMLDSKRWDEAESHRKREFIAISEAKKFSTTECETWNYYIPKERDQSEWDLFYVLLIERKDEKWERVGLGKVFKEAFMRTAKWKEIMLG